MFVRMSLSIYPPKKHTRAHQYIGANGGKSGEGAQHAEGYPWKSE